MKCPCARIHERVSADDNVARIQQQTHLRSTKGVTHAVDTGRHTR